MFRFLHKRIHVYVGTKYNQLLVDIVLICFSFYAAFKRTFGLSLTVFLSTIFTPPVTSIITGVLAVVCVYAAAVKIAYTFTMLFPATRVSSVEVDGVSHSVLRINNEVTRHIEWLSRDDKENTPIRAIFKQGHDFQANVALAMESLARHIISNSKSSKENDIFVSVYQIPEFFKLPPAPSELHYLCHFPPKRDVVASKRINFDDGAHKHYECVKCIRSHVQTWFKIDCSDYHKSASKRHKKIRHYIGLKLQYKDSLLGFLNVEFYNSNFFSDEEEMRVFVEQHMLPFKYLIEYQFLKSTFFGAVHSRLP